MLHSIDIEKAETAVISVMEKEKLTPNLIKAFMPNSMSITITEPTALDSWMQFFKNVPQMGLIVLVIVFSGNMTNELTRGTLINMLTKGLIRKTVILSKIAMDSKLFVVFWCVLRIYSIFLEGRCRFQ